MLHGMHRVHHPPCAQKSATSSSACRPASPSPKSSTGSARPFTSTRARPSTASANSNVTPAKSVPSASPEDGRFTSAG